MAAIANMMPLPPKDELYGHSFWSVNEEPQNILMSQHSKSSKTLNSLSMFYKEFISLENEYARKFSSLVHKLELAKHEPPQNSLTDSIDVFHSQCLKVSEFHVLQAKRVQESLLGPLSEMIGTRKIKEKVIESKITESWKELIDLKEKSESKSLKYEKKWKELNSMQISTLTMNRRELEVFNEKMEALKSKMFVIRDENWELINKYNEKLNDWLTLWFNTCNEWQLVEEQRIRFLKKNIWEFANVLSSFCLETDQCAEMIRLSLEELSASKDVASFVKNNSTGDNVLAPLKFVDFANNETRALHEEQSQKFDRNKVKTDDKFNASTQSKSANRRKAPPSDNVAMISTPSDNLFLEKSKETFRELQQQTEKELSERKMANAENDHQQLLRSSVDSAKSCSEPSTFKVNSDYSGPTAQTSLISCNANTSVEELTNPIAQYRKNQNELHKQNELDVQKDLSGRITDFTLHEREDEQQDHQRLQFLKANTGHLRASMKETSTKTNKRNTLASYVKNAFNEPSGQDESKFDIKQILPLTKRKSFDILDTFVSNNSTKNDQTRNGYDDIETRFQNNSLVLTKTKSSISKSRNISGNLKKSKSSGTLKNKNVNLNELPSKSCGGYDVIAYAKSKYDYDARIEGELTLRKKDILLILHKQEDGWWFSENITSGDSGLAPGNYLVEIERK